MVHCASCGKNIEDDAFFCDQCGREIMVCPTCGSPGKGKWCGRDGLKLVAVRTLRQNDALYRGIDDSSAHPSTLRLINYNEELDIEIHSGDTVGRTAGRHAQIFQRFDNVSSEHLIFDYDRQAGWRAIDLGSTNGTYYQGSRLRSHVPQALANGQIIQIGNVQFLLRITTASSQ